MLMPTSSATSRTVKRRFPRITARTVTTWSSFVDVEGRPGLGIFTDRHSALFKTLEPLTALRSAHAVLSVCLVKQLKRICKMFTKFASKFHTLFSSSALSLIRRTASAHAEFSGCSSTTNAHSETGQMAVCCQNLTLGARSSHSARYMLVGAQFEKFGLFLNTPLIMIQYSLLHVPAVDHHLQAVITVITI